MNKIPFKTLLDKYLTGTISEEERRLMQEMMEEPGQLEAIIDQELQEHTYEGEESKEMLSLIQDNIQEKIRVKKKSSVSILVSMRRLAVAAVFVGILVTVAYLWNTSDKTASKSQIVEHQEIVKNNITPGSNRALLTLADGSHIELDSTSDGTLAQQDGVKIIKLRNGEVVYKQEKHSTEILFNTLATPRGGQYQLVLADGTKVWLNAASSLQFPASFTGNERRVKLTGEGYFEVAKNAAMPFYVQTGDMSIEVLGTHFNVNAYTDEASIRTTLMEGRVKVSRANQSGLLVPGQQAVLSKTGEINVQDADVTEAVAWKNGFFKFKSADMQTVLRQASRWYDVEFEYNANIKDHFSGEISRSVNLMQLLQILELTDKAHFEIEGRKVIVNP